MRLIGLVLAVALTLAPLAAESQQARKIPRIGYLVLSPLADPPSAERAAFLAGRSLSARSRRGRCTRRLTA